MAMKNPPHPGRSIRVSCLEPFDLTVAEGAKALGVTRQTLYKLLNGQSRVSAEMAIRLAKAFGGTPHTWYGMQTAYDLATANKKAHKIKVVPYLPKKTKPSLRQANV